MAKSNRACSAVKRRLVAIVLHDHPRFWRTQAEIARGCDDNRGFRKQTLWCLPAKAKPRLVAVEFARLEVRCSPISWSAVLAARYQVLIEQVLIERSGVGDESRGGESKGGL